MPHRGRCVFLRQRATGPVPAETAETWECRDEKVSNGQQSWRWGSRSNYCFGPFVHSQWLNHGRCCKEAPWSSLICSCRQPADFCCFPLDVKIIKTGMEEVQLCCTQALLRPEQFTDFAFSVQSNRWQGTSRSFSERFCSASAPPQRVSVLDGQVGPMITTCLELLAWVWLIFKM